MLSITAKHALRALVHLATLPEGQTILGRDLARLANIPPNYLSKIFWALGNAGIVDATRGTRGGYKLQRKPANVRLVDVVELFDKPRIGNGCLLATDHPCGDEHACAAHHAWSGVKRAYLDFLENTTLATLTARELHEIHGEP